MENEETHEIVIAFLENALPIDSKIIAIFQTFGFKTLASYERTGLVSTADVRETLSLSSILKDQVLHWLKDNHPSLSSSIHI